MLKKIYSLAIIGLLCCGLALAVQEPPAWPKLELPDGSFRASMPSKPTPGVSEVNVGSGKTNVYTFSAANKLGNFMLSYADYPNAASSPEHAQAVLDEVRNGVLKGTGAALVSETKLTLNGYPGREMQVTKIIEGTEMMFSWRTFLVDRRLYQLAVGTTKADSESPDIKKFFQSFELVK